MTGRAWRGYLLAGIPLTIAYLWLPVETAKLVLWPIIGWSSVIAILIGVRVNRPPSQRAWYLLAAGVATLLMGDILYSVRDLVQHSETLFPSYVDVVYLAMYPLLVAGLALLVHRRSGGRDRAGVIDAAIITAGVGLVSWVMLIAPYVRIEGLTVLERLVSIAYPAGDVALLAIAVRLAVGGGRRPVAFWLLAGSLVPLLAVDAVYGSMNLAGEWREHTAIDIGWIAFYMGWGAAALHPSMRALSIPTADRRRFHRGRLALIVSAVLVPPAMLFVQDARGDVTDAMAIAVASTVLFLLVLIRTSGLARDAADVRGEARFHALVHHASDAIVVLDAEGCVQYLTPSTERVLGRIGAELQGQRLSDVLEDADKERLLVMLSNESATATVEWRILRDDGDWRDLEVVAADMRGTADVNGIVLTMRDITERKQLDAELRRQALHDSLTGLPNRTLFLDRVEQALNRAEPTDRSVAVLFLDLDDFKIVNDSLGHAAGDELLVAVATRITTAARASATVARLGGDEFAMLLESADIDIALEEAALRIQATLRAPFNLRDGEVSVHVSMGMAVGSPRTHTPIEMLRDADLAMYVAKRNGKDRFEKYLPVMHEDVHRRLEIVAELRGAIDRNELMAFYQPIVDLASGRTVGAEALVRWKHPERGLLLPIEFIAIAESTGLIVPLGRWMLHEACRTTAEWKAAGLADDSFYVSVNLSAGHVQDENVLHDVSSALQSSGLAGESLVLEVTETALIEDLSQAGSTLATLKNLGLRIAVDDFGTGYSSLSYLGNFSLDIIKLDKSFVDRVATTADGQRMVRAVVDLAHTLGHTVIAEGVEQPVQAKALTVLGCQLAQGYHFARPMPAVGLASLLEEQLISPVAESRR